MANEACGNKWCIRNVNMSFEPCASFQNTVTNNRMKERTSQIEAKLIEHRLIAVSSWLDTRLVWCATQPMHIFHDRWL